MVKRHLIVKKITLKTRQTKKEYLTEPYQFFITSLDILTYINKEIAEIVKDQIPSKNEDKLNEIHSQMTKTDKKEYSRYIQWRLSPIAKQQRFTTTSKLLAKLLDNQLDLDIKHNRFHMFIKEMSVVYLIVEFEGFLENIMKIVFSINPQILKASDETIRFSEILAVKDYGSLVNIMISKKIKNLINSDIEDIFRYLNKQFKIDLTKEKDYVQFKERFYRRHIIIHNNLYPDEQYRSKSGYTGKDTRLQINDYYLKRSISLYKRYAKIITDQLIIKFA